MEPQTSNVRDGLDDLLADARRLHRSGKLEPAARLCERILATDPGHAPALHLLGLICYGQGHAERAETLIIEAIRRQPGEADFHCDLGVVLERRGAFAEAIEAYDAGLRCDAALAYVHYNRANALRALGHLDAAAAGYRDAIRCNPDHADAHASLGAVLQHTGHAANALAALDRALLLAPGHVGAHCTRGIVLMALGRLDEASSAFDAALRYEPSLVMAHANRGNVLKALGRPSDALAAYDAALRVAPVDGELHYLRGNLLREHGVLEDAVAAYRNAVAFAPTLGKAYNNLAITLQALGRLEQSLSALDRALEINPDHAAAHANRGNVLMERGRFGEAASAYENALELDPGLSGNHSNYLNCLNYDPTRSDEEVHAAHLRWGRLHDNARARPAAYANDRDPNRPLRVGFVSADLGRHPVGYLLQPLMAAADRREMAFYCYSGRAVEDDLSRELKANADAWRRTNALTDADLAAAIEADGIDILIDLSGHTAGNRLGCFALRPAPVRAHWLGYAFTTGLPAMDYALWDRTCVPEGEERWFSETVIRLPVRWCYAPPTYAPAVQILPARRAVTFGSFNNLTKLSADTVATWSAILAAVPGARLALSWMSLADAEECERVRALFAEHGVAPDRLNLIGGAPSHAGVLALYHDVDIALDPFPYSGGLTTLEALWMGVPVITLPGSRPVSRQSASLLAALGRDEWIARDRAHYIGLAVALAADPAARAALRQDQRRRMASSPLCDAPRFARAFAAALREMWRTWLASGAP